MKIRVLALLATALILLGMGLALQTLGIVRLGRFIPPLLLALAFIVRPDTLANIISQIGTAFGFTNSRKLKITGYLINIFIQFAFVYFAIHANLLGNFIGIVGSWITNGFFLYRNAKRTKGRHRKRK